MRLSMRTKLLEATLVARSAGVGSGEPVAAGR